MGYPGKVKIPIISNHFAKCNHKGELSAVFSAIYYLKPKEWWEHFPATDIALFPPTSAVKRIKSVPYSRKNTDEEVTAQEGRQCPGFLLFMKLLWFIYICCY